MHAALDSFPNYILPADAPYLANLSALWEVDSELARALESADDIYQTEPSKNGPVTVAISGAEGAKIYLHSRYNPIDEARRLVQHLTTENKYIYIVHGLGLGYPLEELFNVASEESIFCLFEPDLKLIRTAVHWRDLSKLIKSGRILIFPRLNKGELFTRLHPHMPLVISGMETFWHAPSAQLQPEFHEQFRAWMSEFADYAKTSMQTLLLNGRRTAENIARNIGWYASTPSLHRLKDRYQGEPAIIISAGPSLRKNKHLLKSAQGKAVLVAVQTTLKPMLELGIEPEFVTSLDYHEICTRFFENLPESLRTELVAEPKASDRIFGLFPGRVSLLGNSFAEDLVRELDLHKDTLPAGATVAHLAYYLAEFMGCDPIIFVGQDLGFSDGLCYAPGTSYEDVWRPELSRFCTLEMKQWEQIARDRNILRRIPDIDGRGMYTEERLYTYLQQFERDFLSTKTRIIDATEGGARKRGAAVMKLADALDQFCSRPLRKKEECFSEPPMADLSPQARQCVLARAAEAEQIQSIARQTLPLLRQVEEHLEDQDRVNHLIVRIDALRGRMNNLSKTYDLVTQMTQSTELQRFQADRRIAASKLSGIERQRRQLGRDIANVESLITATELFLDLMQDVADRLAASGSARELSREMAI